MIKKMMFAVIMTASLLTSCSDDEVSYPVQLSGDFKEGTSDIVATRQGGFYNINIATNGDWEAISSEGWVGLEKTSGTGNATIWAYVQRGSFRSGRAAKIEIKTPSETKVINVEQSPLYSFTDNANDIALNNDGEVSFIDVNDTKGLGVGFNVLTGQPTENNIFEYSYIAKQLPNFLTMNSITQNEGSWYSMDSLDDKMDTIGVTLNINVAFGAFKLGINGGYKSSEKNILSNRTYNFGYSLPKESAEYRYANLMAYYRSLTTDSSSVHKNLLSIGFRELYDEIMNIKVDSIDYQKQVNEICEFIDELYGPVFITSTTLGGGMRIIMDCDSSYVTDTMKINGQITASFSSAFKASGSAGYTRLGEQLLQHSNISFKAFGGTQKCADDIADYLMKTESPKSEQLAPLTNAWRNSVTFDKSASKNTCEVVEYKFAGIWTLFPVKQSKAVKKYFMDKYSKINKSFPSVNWSCIDQYSFEETSTIIYPDNNTDKNTDKK